MYEKENVEKEQNTVGLFFFYDLFLLSLFFFFFFAGVVVVVLGVGSYGVVN